MAIAETNAGFISSESVMSRIAAFAQLPQQIYHAVRAGLTPEQRLGAAAAGATCAAMLFALAGLWVSPPPTAEAVATGHAPRSLIEALKPRAQTQVAAPAPVAPASTRPSTTADGHPIAWGLARQPMTVRARAAISEAPWSEAGGAVIGSARPGQRLRVVGQVNDVNGRDYLVIRMNDGAIGFLAADAAVAQNVYRGELAAQRAAEQAAAASAAPVDPAAPPPPVEF